ncbi:CerR family C-terminal domain-containing protein [Aliikangiella maris]|uniref:CerR family C-terminal domain-containing protein n=2 Tax=Aliikangiella maris TaxID=3162458 RepID=A0ABV3MU47_9GAMM
MNTKDSAKQRLIQAAIEIFGRDGFHAASNRHLANTAKVNLALISYHFGGKEGLYLAVFEHIAEQITTRFSAVGDEIEQQIQHVKTLDDMTVPRQCIHIIEQILFTFVDMLSSPQTAPWAKLILREQQTPTKAFQILYEGPWQYILTLLAQPIALALGKSKSHAQVKLMALNLMGQVQILRSARATIQAFMDWESIEKKQTDLIKKQLHQYLVVLLNTDFTQIKSSTFTINYTTSPQ